MRRWSPRTHLCCIVMQVAAPDRMGEAVSAAMFGLPEDSVRVRLEVALIPPQARPLTFCIAMHVIKARHGSSCALCAVRRVLRLRLLVKCASFVWHYGPRQPCTL